MQLNPVSELRLNTKRRLLQLLIIASAITIGSSASAQERDHAPRTRASALARLERFQQSVKDKIKSAFGSDEKQAPLPLDAQGPHDSVAQTGGDYVSTQSQAQEPWDASALPLQSDVHVAPVPGLSDEPPVYRESTSAYSQYMKPEPGGLSRSISHRRSNETAQAIISGDDSSKVQTASMEPYLKETPATAVQYQQDALSSDGIGPYGMTSSSNDRNSAYPNNTLPVPPPIRTQPITGAMMVGNPRTPTARGTILGEEPLTATQHALRLIEENGDLKAKLATSLAEGERLREKLTSTQSLLQNSTEAVASAQDEMDRLTHENRQLERKLAEAESKYNRYLRETDRMLESIREELDEVLVRELSTDKQ